MIQGKQDFDPPTPHPTMFNPGELLRREFLAHLSYFRYVISYHSELENIKSNVLPDESHFFSTAGALVVVTV